MAYIYRHFGRREFEKKIEIKKAKSNARCGGAAAILIVTPTIDLFNFLVIRAAIVSMGCASR